MTIQSPEQKFALYQIAAAMVASGMPTAFAVRAVELGCVSEGVHDLLVLWRDTPADDVERDAIIDDIQEAIDDEDNRHVSPVEKPKVGYQESGDLGREILAFKAELRNEVDRWGGIPKLAESAMTPLGRLLEDIGNIVNRLDSADFSNVEMRIYYPPDRAEIVQDLREAVVRFLATEVPIEELAMQAAQVLSAGLGLPGPARADEILRLAAEAVELLRRRQAEHASPLDSMLEQLEAKGHNAPRADALPQNLLEALCRDD